jgi:hypothetical protein
MQQSPLTRGDRVSVVVGGLVFALAAVALYVRTHFAIDFSDDSFYVALPYSFTLGHRPIADEVAIHQFAGMMTTPFVELFLWITGSAEGLVLYVRHLYVLFAVATAAVAARYLARLIGLGSALLISACVLAYVPFNLPNLSYNTIASLGLTSGLFLLASSVHARRPWLDQFFGTLALAIATIAYLPLAVVTVPATLVSALHFQRREKLRGSRVPPSFLAGGLAAAWLITQLTSYADFESLRRLLDLSEAIGLQGGGAKKLVLFGRQLTQQREAIAANVLLVAGIAAIFRWLPNRWISTGLLLLAGGAFHWVAATFPVRAQPQRAPMALLILALAALPYLLGKSPRGWDRHWAGVRGVGLASAGAAICFAWSSANGLRNLAIALMPMTLLGLALLSRPRTGEEAAGARSGTWAPLAGLMVSLLCFAIFDLYRHVYRDGPIRTLVAEVETGAYQGIRTTAGKARFIASFEQDLASVRCSSETVMFLDYFPAGYLLTDLRPRTAALWMFFFPTERPHHHPTRSIYAEPFEDGPLPDLLVDMRMTILDWKKPAIRPDWDPVRLQLARGRYEQLIERPEYTILRLQGAGEAPIGAAAFGTGTDCRRRAAPLDAGSRRSAR